MALEKLAAFSTPSLFAFIFDLKASNSNRNSAHSLAMPLFSSTPPASPSHTTPAPSADGAYIAPDRNARAHCWEARDTFFACLERNDIVDSIKEKEKAGSVCGNEDREFGKECAKSWVIYFKQRRVMEHNKAQTLARLKKENAKPLPEGMGPPGVQGRTP